MATVFRSPITVLQFFGNNGLPLVGGTLLTTVGGINTTTYQDAAGSIPLPNPIPLNSRGEISNAAGQSCELWLLANTIYTFTLFDASGNQINQYPNIAGALDASSGVTLAGNNTFTGANTFSGNVSVIDANFTVVDNIDATKKIAFQAAGLPTSTTALLNVAAANIVEGVLGTIIASAATVNLDTATGDYDAVSGTATTTAFTLTQGRLRTVVAPAGWLITASANVIMTGVVASAATYTTQAGDVLTFRGEAAGVVRLVGFTPINPPAVLAAQSGAGGTSMVLLSTKTAANSASLSFTPTDFSWTAYDEYEFHFISCVPGTSGAIMQAQISENAGSSYISSANYSQNNEVVTGTSITVTTGSSQTSLTITGTQSSNAALNLFNGKLIFYRPWETGHNKTIEVVNGSYVNSAGPALERKRMYGSYSGDTNAINGIQFAESTGNYSGTIAVYGIKKS